MEVSSASSKTGVAHEYGYGQPVAPAHDRGHECTQALRGDAEGPYSQLQAVCCVSQAVPGHGHRGGYTPVSTASFRDLLGCMLLLLRPIPIGRQNLINNAGKLVELRPERRLPAHV